MNEYIVGTRERPSPEERTAIIVSPLLIVAGVLFGIPGFAVALFIVPAIAMAWADWAQTQAGVPWSPCSCRTADPYQMTRSMGKRRIRTGITLIVLAVVLFLIGLPLVFGILALWAGIATMIAVPLKYGGCPELGLLASILRGGLARSGCGPWCWGDRHELPGTRTKN